MNKRAAGFGLLGMILTLALGAGVLTTVYTAYAADQAAAAAAQATAEAAQIQQSVSSAYASAPDYQSLNNAAAVREGLFPASTLRAGQPVNPWGGSIQVAGLTNGYALTFETVPASACGRLAAAGARDWDDVKINGQSVMAGHALASDRLASACSNPSATVQFLVAHRDRPALASCLPMPDETRASACPTGQASTVPPYGTDGVTETRSSVCVSAYGAPVWGPWQVTSSTCGAVAACGSTCVNSGGGPGYWDTSTARCVPYMPMCGTP